MIKNLSSWEISLKWNYSTYKEQIQKDIRCFWWNDNTIDKKYYVDYLINKYGKLGLTRQETADELGISLSFLDKLLREGVGLPNYRKIGKSQKPRIVFPVDSVANFMIVNSNWKTNLFTFCFNWKANLKSDN